MKHVAALLLLALVPAVAAPPRPRPTVGVRTAAEAKRIAEQETRGIAVSARRTYLNGATCGWEVVVRMPGEARGWRCMVDCDTRMVATKDRIPNPPGKGSKP